MLLVWLLPITLLIALCGSVIAIGVWLSGRKQGNNPETGSRGSGCAIAGCAWAPFVLLASLVFGVPFLTGVRPASADFEEGFGVPAGSEIRNLRGKTEAGVDARTIYLAFDNTPDAREAIVGRLPTANRVPQTDRLDSDLFSGNAPSWFKAGATGMAEGACLKRKLDEFHDALGWDDVIVVQCASDQRIYVLFSNID